MLFSTTIQNPSISLATNSGRSRLGVVGHGYHDFQKDIFAYLIKKYLCENSGIRLGPPLLINVFAPSVSPVSIFVKKTSEMTQQREERT